MTFKKQFFLIFLTYIIILSPLYAQQSNNQNQPPIQEETELKIADEETPALPQEQENRIEKNLSTFTFWDFLRMILILLFVIACIYGLFFILKKAGSQKFAEDDLINVISSKSISAGKTLHIVEVGNQMIVIGAADNSISTLIEITDKETIDNIRLRKGEIKKPSENSFQQYLLNTIFRKKGETKDKSFKDNINFDYFKKQRDRIGKM